MSHTPFIIASYLAATVILGWCAVQPLLRARRLVRQLRRGPDSGDSHAPDA